MIFVEKTNYIWGDSMPQGIRMTVPDSQDSVNSIPQEAQMFDMNKEMNYSCSPWSVDDSYFKVPNNIKFMDISQMMNQITPTTSTGGTVDIKTAQCSVCDSLPERDKVQCRQTLGCK